MRSHTSTGLRFQPLSFRRRRHRLKARKCGKTGFREASCSVQALTRLVSAAGLRFVISGVVVGLVAAFLLSRLLESMVYGVSRRDPLVFVLVSLVMIAVSLLACYVPARRASRVDAITALRYEYPAHSH